MIDEPRHSDEEAPVERPEDIAALVGALARPHRSGGVVIERAAILASGSSSAEMLAWITAHGGQAEDAVEAPSSSGGLYGGMGRDRAGAAARRPLRYVLPAGAL